MNMDVYQEMAVRSTGQNILVSASAGAGKTRVLVERLIKRCLEDRVGMDEVLASAAGKDRREEQTAFSKRQIEKALEACEGLYTQLLYRY